MTFPTPPYEAYPLAPQLLYTKGWVYLVFFPDLYWDPFLYRKTKQDKECAFFFLL